MYILQILLQNEYVKKTLSYFLIFNSKMCNLVTLLVGIQKSLAHGHSDSYIVADKFQLVVSVSRAQCCLLAL